MKELIEIQRELKVPKNKNRKLACDELYEMISSYEKVKKTTVYRKIYWDRRYEAWRYIGKAHDYSW